MRPQPAIPLTPDSPALSRIGRFYVTRELGRGTIGCVYLGHDPMIARDVALKTFNPRLSELERNKYEEQFINEARAAGRLAHPHIVTIYDVSLESDAPYIAMEYLQGRELDKVLDGGHRYKPEEAASIAWKIADALHHAHQNQVIHRDVKPANIFILKDDQPKLVDFGIARSPNRVPDKFAQTGDPVTLVRPTKRIGTPNYMSPEQAAGGKIDERTDIYSLGVVMYEMLTGRKPFQADSADKLLLQIAGKTPPSPTELDHRVPELLSRIVMTAMNKRPEKRYQNAGEMTLDIKRYLLKSRRARRSMKLAIAASEAQSGGWQVSSRTLAWMGYLSLTAAAVLTAFALLR